MATKRSKASESLSAGAAPARAKSPVTRKHRNASAEKSDVSVTISSSPATLPVSGPSFNEIAQLAYSFWEARGYQGGSSEEDWMRAEHELRAALTQSVAN